MRGRARRAARQVRAIADPERAREASTSSTNSGIVDARSSARSPPPSSRPRPSRAPPSGISARSATWRARRPASAPADRERAPSSRSRSDARARTRPRRPCARPQVTRRRNVVPLSARPAMAGKRSVHARTVPARDVRISCAGRRRSGMTIEDVVCPVMLPVAIGIAIAAIVACSGTSRGAIRSRPSASRLASGPTAGRGGSGRGVGCGSRRRSSRRRGVAEHRGRGGRRPKKAAQCSRSSSSPSPRSRGSSPGRRIVRSSSPEA